MSATCQMCGRSLSEHDRHVRFTLPDPVLDLPEREQTPGTWMSHGTARQSVMVQIPNVGAFVRVLLPVHLTENDSLTFGTWLAIDPRDDALRKLAAIWTDDARYQHLRLSGWLANAIPPWGMLRAPVETEVRDVKETPYCASSDDHTLTRVLTETWDRTEVLTASKQV